MEKSAIELLETIILKIEREEFYDYIPDHKWNDYGPGLTDIKYAIIHMIEREIHIMSHPEQ